MGLDGRGTGLFVICNFLSVLQKKKVEEKINKESKHVEYISHIYMYIKS